jgi:hypothetical protein
MARPLFLAAACVVPAASAPSSGWAHGWETPASAWWGYGAMSGSVFSDADVAFAARTYRVVVLSICMGANTSSVADTIIDVAARLKALAPGIKALQYFNMQQWACYNAEEPDYKTFMENPAWWLLDDAGKPVLNNGSPQYDWTKPAAVAHFVAMPLTRGGVSLDGFLLDGGAVYDPEAGVSADRAEALKLAKWAAVGALQARLTALNGGLVLANGMAGGPIDPHVDDPFNLGVLAFSDGVENERGSPAFEQVDGSTGAYRKDAIALNLAAAERAGQMSNGSKVVALNYWPGPIVGFPPPGNNSSGWPMYAPNDPVHRTPNGTRAEVIQGWTDLLSAWLPYNLASFLTVAGPSSYFTEMAWYAAVQGFAPCPDAPDSCAFPTPQAAAVMNNSLGPPLGPRVQLGPYKWVRKFAHAVVTLDLDEPLGPGTSIVWS